MVGLMDFWKAVVLGTLAGLLAPIAKAIVGFLTFIPSITIAGMVVPHDLIATGLAVFGAIMITRNVEFLRKVSF